MSKDICPTNNDSNNNLSILLKKNPIEYYIEKELDDDNYQIKITENSCYRCNNFGYCVYLGGFKNLGYTCYIGSIFCILSHIDSFRTKLSECRNDNELISELKRVINNSCNNFKNHSGSVSIKKIKKLLDKKNRHLKTNASDFLKFLLEEIQMQELTCNFIDEDDLLNANNRRSNILVIKRNSKSGEREINLVLYKNYKIKGIIVLIGNEGASHNVSYVYENEKWYEYNDEFVKIHKSIPSIVNIKAKLIIYELKEKSDNNNNGNNNETTITTTTTTTTDVVVVDDDDDEDNNFYSKNCHVEDNLKNDQILDTKINQSGWYKMNNEEMCFLLLNYDGSTKELLKIKESEYNKLIEKSIEENLVVPCPGTNDGEFGYYIDGNGVVYYYFNGYYESLMK